MASRMCAFAGVVSFVVLFSTQPFAQSNSTFGQGAFRPGNGITPPSLISQIVPKYTTQAMRAKISGDIELEAVVNTDGTVVDVRVVKSLDGIYGLDQNAILAAKQWLFKPGHDRDGRAVPVIVT